MKILFLAHLFPLPLDSGGKIKTYHTLKALAGRHEVRVVAYLRDENERSHLPDLLHLCPQVEPVPLSRGKATQIADLASSLLTRRSFIVSRDFRADMLQAVQREIDRFRPDIVHIDHLQMAQFVDFSGPYATVLDHHNVESAIIQRIAKTSASPPTRVYANIEWPKLRAYELDVCRKCDLVLTVSDEDKNTIQTLDPAIRNVCTVPIGVDVHGQMPVERNPDSQNILSLGAMHWPPNIDSMRYFCRDIYPLVKRKFPACRLTIAGQRPPRAIRSLASDRSITVTGYVNDTVSLARDCGVFVVPLRSGSGVRVKILNAMAMSLPIVSTSIGAEGLAVTPGEHMLIADTPATFANAVTRVLSNRDLAQRLGRAGRELAVERYSWDIVGQTLLKVYDQCIRWRLSA